MNKKEDTIHPTGDIPVLFKIGVHFFNQDGIQSVSRFGKGCKINLINGDEFLVRINYNKVAELIK